MPATLTLYLFLSFSSNIPPFCFFLLILGFYSLVFHVPLVVLMSSLVHGKGPFIVPTMTGFYYFDPQQPLSGLGVLANHHWFVCVPLPIAKRKKTIFFVYLSWYLFLLWCGCLLSPYPSLHASSDSNSALLLLGGMSSQQDTSPKRA